MSWEYIAEPFSGRWPEEPEWIEFQVKIAIRYLKLICGNPPAGCRLAQVPQLTSKMQNFSMA